MREGGSNINLELFMRNASGAGNIEAGAGASFAGGGGGGVPEHFLRDRDLVSESASMAKKPLGGIIPDIITGMQGAQGMVQLQGVALFGAGQFQPPPIMPSQKIAGIISQRGA